MADVDPGDFATNTTVGSRRAYLLVREIVVSNLTATLIQYLCAEAGMATGLRLPALCRAHFSRPVR